MCKPGLPDTRASWLRLPKPDRTGKVEDANLGHELGGIGLHRVGLALARRHPLKSSRVRYHPPAVR